jgi:hypothetical protein
VVLLSADGRAADAPSSSAVAGDRNSVAEARLGICSLALPSSRIGLLIASGNRKLRRRTSTSLDWPRRRNRAGIKGMLEPKLRIHRSRVFNCNMSCSEDGFAGENGDPGEESRVGGGLGGEERRRGFDSYAKTNAQMFKNE